MYWTTRPRGPVALVTTLRLAPVTGTLEQVPCTALILENALAPEDPVPEVTASRDIPVVAGRAQLSGLLSLGGTPGQGQSGSNEEEPARKSRREAEGNLEHGGRRCGFPLRNVNHRPPLPRLLPTSTLAVPTAC